MDRDDARRLSVPAKSAHEDHAFSEAGKRGRFYACVFGLSAAVGDGRLGPILFQLAPSFKCDTARLAAFVRGLPKTIRAAFEFRNATWFSEECYQVMRDSNIGLCLAENENLETPHVITADFVYLRLRKPDYSESELASVDYRVRQYRSNCYPTYAIFKHEETPAGALYAERLLASQLHPAAS